MFLFKRERKEKKERHLGRDAQKICYKDDYTFLFTCNDEYLIIIIFILIYVYNDYKSTIIQHMQPSLACRDLKRSCDMVSAHQDCSVAPRRWDTFTCTLHVILYYMESL